MTEVKSAQAVHRPSDRAPVRVGTKWRDLHCGNQRWQVADEYRDVLFGDGALPWAAWQAQGRVRIVKQGTHRTVYRVDLAEQSLYLKHYHSRSRLNWWRHLLRASASRRECRKAQELSRRQVPTVQPVAVGETLRGGVVTDHFLVTAAIRDSVSLRSWIEEIAPRFDAREQGHWRRVLLMAAARLCAVTHQGGIDHDDFHLGNVLLQVDSAGRPKTGSQGQVELYLIDLPKAQVGRSLGRQRSCKSLAMLAAGALEFTSRRDRWRFWKEYRRCRPDWSGDARRDARAIESCAVRWTRHIVRSRDGRSMETNKDFWRCRRANGSGHAVTDVDREWLHGAIDDPERILRENLSRVAKLSHTSLIVETEVATREGAVGAAFKRCRARTWWKQWLGFVGRDRAMRGWRLGHALLSRGIATARPLAVIRPKGWIPRESYLVTQWLPGATDLHQFLWQAEGLLGEARETLVEGVAERLGRLIGRMHTWGVTHRDLKGCNLLVQSSGNRETRVYLLDLDGVRLQRSVGLRLRSRNLARLAISCQMHPWLPREARRAFWRGYCEAGEVAGAQREQLATLVRQEMEDQLARRKRQGRPTA